MSLEGIPNLNEPVLFGPKSLNISHRWWKWLQKFGKTPQWQAAVLQNGWVAYGGAYAPPSYSIDALGIVRLRGLVKGGTTTVGTVILNVPIGYRPVYALDLMAFSSNGGAITIVEMDMTTAGNLTLDGVPGNTWLSLDQVSYATY